MDCHKVAQRISKYLEDLQSTQKYLKIPKSKLAEKTDIKSENVTLANDDHHVFSILLEDIEPKQAMLCNVELDNLCSVDMSIV